MEVSSYHLSRYWFDWCFENPEKVSPNHTAIYFFAIEHCNRLGWKEKFGFPTQMAMDAIGIKKHQTYIRYFNDLCEWGFFKLIQKSQNQYSANIISIKSALPKNGKALDKAFITHAAKQIASNGQSNSSIDKPITNNQLTNKQGDQNFYVSKEEAFEDMKLNDLYMDEVHRVITGKGWRGATKVDVLKILHMFLVGKADLNTPRQNVKQHFKNYLYREDVNNLVKISDER